MKNLHLLLSRLTQHLSNTDVALLNNYFVSNAASVAIGSNYLTV